MVHPTARKRPGRPCAGRGCRHPGRKAFKVNRRPRHFSSGLERQAEPKKNQKAFKDIADVGEILLGETYPVKTHIEAIRSTHGEYGRKLLDCLTCGVSLSGAVKSRVFAAAWICKEYEITEALLKPNVMNLAELLKAVKLLDSGRQIRVLQQSTQTQEELQRQNPSPKRAKRITRLKTSLHNLQQEENPGSVSGALSRRLRKWCRQFEEDALEFYMLNFPRNSWKQLADLIHCSPKDFSVPYFLVWACTNSPPPSSSFVSIVSGLSEDSKVDELRRLAELYPEKIRKCFAFLRKKLGIMDHTASREIKGELAKLLPLEEVIWWFEELQCDEVVATLTERLAAGENIASDKSRTGYAKLMERLLIFQRKSPKLVELLLPVAERQLESVKDDFKAKTNGASARVAIFGDASSSMQICINVGSIISSLLSAILNGEFMLFNSVMFMPPVQPRTVHDVLSIVNQIRASSTTSIAAPLYELYHEEKAVDLIVVVTDEEENEPSLDGHYFVPLFKIYREEIAPHCKLWLVSFLSDVRCKTGRLEADLNNEGLQECYQQFRMDSRRPDLTKFDSLLAKLAVDLSNKS